MNSEQPLTIDQARGLSLYDRIVAGRLLIGYSYATGPAGTETLGSQFHVLILNDAPWSDKVWAA